MSDVDSNGVDRLDRFRAYSERFRQFSVAEEVYLDTLEYIKIVRKERDEARREICLNEANDLSLELGGMPIAPQFIAKKRGWNCYEINKDEIA